MKNIFLLIFSFFCLLLTSCQKYVLFGVEVYNQKEGGFSKAAPALKSAFVPQKSPVVSSLPVVDEDHNEIIALLRSSYEYDLELIKPEPLPSDQRIDRTGLSVRGRVLTFFNVHTNEKITVSYRSSRGYNKAALLKISRIMRDWRTREVKAVDPKLIDYLWDLRKKSGSKGSIVFVSGYRSSKTNAQLRKTSTNVARRSQHIHGKAIDFYFSDVSTPKVVAISRSMKRGGTGSYGGRFMHIDTGPVRSWHYQ